MSDWIKTQLTKRMRKKRARFNAAKLARRKQRK